jgi:2-polyprenyl-6-methoxyphenol hydroxylase-like FAD-dependent oxidoreductase
MMKRVLIVGAGVAGLSLAIALRRKGIDAELIERSAAHSTEGAGVYLVGNATRALRTLGMEDRVLLNGSRIQTQTIFNYRGGRVSVANVDAFWKHCGPCVGVRRAHLHGALAEAARGLPLHFGRTLRSLEQQPDSVSVQLEDGSTAAYDVVVGADGIRSSVRQLEFGNTSPGFRGQMGWRFIAPLPPGISGWSAFLAQGRSFLFVPVGNGEAYCYADQSVPQVTEDPAAGRLQRLRSLLSDFAAPVRETLERMRDTDVIHHAPIEQVTPPQVGRGRVVLIGDAAHAMSPNMANGAAMAFEDAWVLADVLSGTASVPVAVEEFVRRRAARVAWVRSQTDRRDRMRTLNPLVRNTVMRLLWPRIYAANYRPLLAPP